MPNISWDELSTMRHSLSGTINALQKLEISIRDYFRGVNPQENTCSCLNQIGRIRDGLIKDIAELDTMIGKHEDE